MTELTDRQLEVLSFINRFRETAQCNPTCSEIAIAFGFASPNAANDHLRALAYKGAITYREGHRARGYIVQNEWMDA